jgi:hypothetical protein
VSLMGRKSTAWAWEKGVAHMTPITSARSISSGPVLERRRT